MKNRQNIGKITFPSLFMAVLSGTGLAQVNVDDIEALIRSFEAREHFFGVVLVAQNEQVLFRKAYGLANREWDVPNTVDTKFRIGDGISIWHRVHLARRFPPDFMPFGVPVFFGTSNLFCSGACGAPHNSQR